MINRRDFLKATGATVIGTTTLEQLRAAKERLRQQQRQIETVLGGRDPEAERRRNQERAREATATAKDVTIPRLTPVQLRRRKRLEKNDSAWLRYYFGTKSNCPDPFWYPFTGQQKEMIAAMGHAARWGGDQSLAASRGEGKTTIFRRLLIKYALQGIIKFGVLCGATGTAAGNSLEAMRDAIETNDLLCEDYPEICVPVRALENTPNRAHYQTVSGFRHDTGEPFTRASSRFSWCGQEIVLPNVPGSPGAGAVIATRGLDAALYGLNRKGKRPDIVGVDDPDTDDTARSEEQAKKLEDRIDRALGGLGGQQKNVARVMLTTLHSRISVSFRFTDPAQKPSWQGKRFRFLVKPPDRADLWDEYVQLRHAAFQQTDEHGDSLDPFARIAHKFYLANRKAMDAGAVVANKYRFNGERLADGSRLEVSALQRYYNEVARIGQEAVSTEYDNDPPEDSGPIESGITAYRVQRQLSGYARRVVPPGCTVVVQGIDVRKVGLHYVVRAWQPNGTGYTIDYGVQDVVNTVYGSDEGLEFALLAAFQARMEVIREKPYTMLDGTAVPVSLTLIDAGWQTDAVYHFCNGAGQSVKPAMGFGRSNGCVQTRFSDVVNSTRQKKPGGDGWFRSLSPKRVWYIGMDADKWKLWEHARWMTDPGKPGAMHLWGEPGNGKQLSFDEKSHFAYSKHIVAEVETEEIIRGTVVRRLKAKSGGGETNHYLDASYMADVAGNMMGIRLLQDGKATGGQYDGRWFAAQEGKHQ